MNSYLLTRLFYRELEESEAMQVTCTPHHQALFFRIVQVQNQVGWTIKNFDLPTESTMFYSCIGSYKTYKKCLADLLTWNLVEQVTEAKNQFQARKVSLYTEKWIAFIAESGAERLSEQATNTSEASTETNRNAGSIQSQGTNPSDGKAVAVNKTSKPLKEETSKPLNLKTSKQGVLQASPKGEKGFESGINFSTVNEDSQNKADLLNQEKKKVAPKRKESSAELQDNSVKLTDGSTKLKDKLLKPDLLFTESAYAEKAAFIAAFSGSEYATANLDYYYEIIKNWSESKQAKKKDWIATAKNWMLKDFKEGKLVTYEPLGYAKPTNTNAAGQTSYTGLGNAVDDYFERKFGK
jgi:hypothetical protein